jgi:hypothetical protein
MKIILFILLLITNHVFSQSFEGKLIYTNTFEFIISEKMKQMGLTKEMFSEKMKNEGKWIDTLILTYQQGNYHYLANSDPRSWTIYKPETNKIYIFQEGAGADMCIVSDASVDVEHKMTGKMPVIKKLDSLVTVNGITCNIVRVEWKAGTYDYYYNSEQLLVDPKLFAGHIHDGWAEFLKISHALPQRIIRSAGNFVIITSTLVKVEPSEIDSALFAIPELVPEINKVEVPNGGEIMRIKKK